MPRKAIPITEAMRLFPNFQPAWKPHNPECHDPESVAIGHPHFARIRHVVTVEVDEYGLPVKPLWDQIRLEEGPQNRTFPGTVTVPYCTIDGEIHVILRRHSRPVRESDSLEFTQGIVEGNETVTGCARREIREELGIDVLKVTELPEVCAEPDWFPRGTKIVAVQLNAKQVTAKKDQLNIFPISDLSFISQIDAATSVSAVMRFLAWLQYEGKCQIVFNH